MTMWVDRRSTSDPDVDLLRLNIAGIRLLLSSPLPFASIPFPPEYQSFCVSAGHGAPDDLQVLMKLGIPDRANWGELSTAAKPWRLFREGEVRRLVWDGSDPGQPLWLAEFVPGTPSITVYCGSKLIEGDGDLKALRNPMHYPLDQLLMLYQLAGRGKGIVHSAGLILKGTCIVAAGRSGAGKSTLSRCWAARHGTESLLSDDRMIIGCNPRAVSGATAYGTPWPGELGAARNAEAPLGAIVFLEKAKVNSLVPISSQDAMERLLPVTSIPWFEPEIMSIALANIERWLADVPAYVFQFTPDEGAVRMLETVRELSDGPPSGAAKLPV